MWLPVDQDDDGFEPPADCDDTNQFVNPGATEVPYNGVDEDCDGWDLTDVDGDGFDATEVGGDDCADANEEIHPDAEELCGDNRDNNCDGYIDDECWVDDPTQPGGISWTCGPVLPPSQLLVLFALGLLLWRRRAIIY